MAEEPRRSTHRREATTVSTKSRPAFLSACREWSWATVRVAAVYNVAGQLPMNLEQQRDTIIDIAARHGARNVRVFGSVARGDDRPASDLDLLVDMESDRSLLDLVGLAQDLEALLHRNVDVVTDASLHDAIREQVLAESRPL